jgi:hypothetical protein
MAVSKLAPQPVAFYAAVFFLVNVTYIGLIWELIDRTPGDMVSPTVRRIMRVRSITTLCLFGVAAVVALKYPLAGLGICICCLIVYLKPDPPGTGEAHNFRINVNIVLCLDSCPTRTSRDVPSPAAVGGIAEVWRPDQAKPVYDYTA